MANISKVLREWRSKLRPLSRKLGPKAWIALKVAVLGGLAVAIIGLFAFTIFAAWVSRDLPDPNSLITRSVQQSTKIFDRTGEHLLYEIHGDERRTLVKIENIPNSMQKAAIAIEDRLFYEHNGVYWRGFIRAGVMSVLRGQKLQGTSTLTQQLVRNAILTTERSYVRKLREIILSLQIEQKYSKEEILQLYLNEIPFGSNLYGVESASLTYFGHPAKELTLDESALLAAIIQRPDYFSPYGTGLSGDNRVQLVQRQHTVLDKMAAEGFYPQAEVDAAKEIKTLDKIKPRRIGNIDAPHFVMYVRDLLETTYGDRTVAQGGLKVITTLDWNMQQAAEEEVKKGVEALGKQYKFTNAALVALEPKTGQVLTMVGSKDFFDEQIDGQFNVTLSERQPGSSFKPIVYASAFMRGYLPETQVWDVNTTFKTEIGKYEPKNYSLKENGPVSLRQALAGSLNIPAVKVLYLVGVGRVLDFAESLGYSTLKDRSRFGLSLVLGGAEVKPIEHAAAFAAFATDGEWRPTSAVLRVEDADGKILEEWKDPEPRRVMDQQIARLINDVLSDNNARAYIFGGRNSLTLPDRPVAAKTGTTNNNHDAWTAGYTPDLVSVVWVGNNDNTEMKSGADGSIVAAPIWQAFMKRALKDKPVTRFTKPTPPQTTRPILLGKVFEQKIKVNKVSGKLATDQTPPELVEERIGREAHTILYYVDKDDPTGPPPSNPAEDPQFGNWESAVQAWVSRTGWNATSSIPLQTDDAFTEETRPQIGIISPQTNGSVFSRQTQVSLSINSTRPIMRVEAFVEGIPVGSGLTAPWNFPIRIPNRIGKGFRTLVVRAYDNMGQPGEASLTFNLEADADPNEPTISIIVPSNGETWARSTFPKIIRVRLEEPSKYDRVDVSFIGADGVDRLVGTQALPSSNDFTVSVPAGPPSGAYNLVAKAKKANTDQYDRVQVTINITE
ncbi:penicillin-binding protein [Candidatus Uhrbacteria bacterium]|nr:penicillin-binding protein [Candidatus Uhrbacteria bacterium]